MSLTAVAVFAVAGCGTTSSSASDVASYPDKNVTVIVPFGAGGGADSSFRAFQTVAEPLGPTITVTNVEGAGGVTGWTQFLNSEPDGYTLSLATPPFNIVPKLLQPESTPYSLDDFTYICTYSASPDTMYMNANETRFSDLDSLIAYARENPGQVTAGVTGAVGTDAIHVYRLQDLAGIELRMIPFDSATDVTAAVVSGDVDLSFSDLSWVTLAANDLSPVAIATEEPLTEHPDIPTYTQSGIDLVSVRLRSLSAQPGTPEQVLSYWEDICRTVTDDPQFAAELGKTGQPVQFYDAQQTRDVVAQMTETIQAVIDEQGLATN
ncbi:tripartite tricarboxylate transporter substrate binding protein [Mycolicibacterium sp.]|uniref:tripartite tricarboxylate transporter substrate binding protein n=2 Tax=Mycolicibacterium sp. TaxID=2320850 RepID=UPI003D0E36CB